MIDLFQDSAFVLSNSIALQAARNFSVHSVAHPPPDTMTLNGVLILDRLPIYWYPARGALVQRWGLFYPWVICHYLPQSCTHWHPFFAAEKAVALKAQQRPLALHCPLWASF